MYIYFFYYLMQPCALVHILMNVSDRFWKMLFHKRHTCYPLLQDLFERMHKGGVVGVELYNIFVG
jgi:hypothetical protein